MNIHQYWFSFGFQHEATNDRAAYIEYPINPEEALRRTNLTDAGTMISNPPPGWINIYENFDPEPGYMQKLVQAEPTFNADLGKWLRQKTVVNMSLEEMDAYVEKLRYDKRQEINRGRASANTGFFWHQGKRIQCDLTSMFDLLGTNGKIALHRSLPVDWNGGWKTMDNGYIPISTIQAWEELYDSLYSQGHKNFMHSQALKAMVENAKSIQDLEKISWQTDTGILHT